MSSPPEITPLPHAELHPLDLTPGASDALLIVDVQNDFLPGGALAVPEGDAILPIIRDLVRLPFGLIATSQDWHPAEHVSFQTAIPAGKWPPHCVAHTHGAALASGLTLPSSTLAVFKGTQAEQDSYSAFGGTDAQGLPLAALLQKQDITRVFVCGLALDYCVRASALDAHAMGFQTILITDACRGIAEDLTPILTELREGGVSCYTSQALGALKHAQ